MADALRLPPGWRQAAAGSAIEGLASRKVLVGLT